MRIRRRPPLPLSPPPFQNPNLSSLQIQEPANTRGNHHDASGLLHPDDHGDLSASKPQSDSHPKQAFKEEKDALSSFSSSYNRTLDTQVHDNERNNGGEMESDAKDKFIDTLSNHQASTTTTTSDNIDRVVVSEEEVMVMINGRKRRSPASSTVLVEGSRCSRVNGRGWRCNQQTFIGYSLCEHHLGKGRLRSVGSIRGGGRQKPTSNARNPKKIRERVSAVKARSISSLLGEAAAAAGPSVDAMAAAAGSNMALV